MLITTGRTPIAENVSEVLLNAPIARNCTHGIPLQSEAQEVHPR